MRGGILVVLVVAAGCSDDDCCRIDASVGGTNGDGSLPCVDDSALEPNDSVGTAFDTGADSNVLDFAVANLAICPGNDRDYYKVTIS